MKRSPVARGGGEVDLRRIDLNLLVSLRCLLQERHVTGAAERMSVSQPAMSASLARLRTLLDDPLLVRAGRQLVLTPFAESLLEPVSTILLNIEQTLSVRPHFDPATDSRTFAIGATDYMTFVFLRRIVFALPSLAKDVRLHVEPVLPGYSNDLRAGRLDLLILPHEVAQDIGDLESAPLFSDRFVGAASAENTEVDDMTVETFSSLPYLAYQVNGRSSNVDVQLDALGVKRNVEMMTESFLVPPLILAGSRMIAMIHERTGTLLAESAGLRLFEAPVPLEPIHQALFWHPRLSDDPAHRWIRDRIVEMAHDRGSSGVTE
ncbi:MAG: LysR family transcriptional regulator protein [Polaromonas sp.]|jgi:DNA-binding transcriptional LysR family regulator|nr:LysR family transcriptional regulator protein [Polaromonas sp.]